MKIIYIISFLLLSLCSTLYSQKIFIHTDEWVSPVSYDDDIKTINEYMGMYQFDQPAEDEYGRPEGDGYMAQIFFEYVNDTLSVYELFQIEYMEVPEKNYLSSVKITDNVFTAEGYGGAFKILNYKDKKGKTKKTPVLIIYNKDNPQYNYIYQKIN